MKSIKTILLQLGLIAFSFPSFGQAGMLDSTFNSDGAAFFHFNGGRATAATMVVLPNEKILVAGTAVTGPGADSDFLLLRYNPDGSLDGSFGDGGFAIFSWGGQNDAAKAMVVQPDGKILVAGWTVSNGKNYGLLCRFTTDGVIDKTFGGGDGVIYEGNELPVLPTMDLFLTQDGQILWCKVTKQYDTSIIRFSSTGEVDTLYGKSGVAYVGLSGGTAFQGTWAMLPDNRIVGECVFWHQGFETTPDYVNAFFFRFSQNGTKEAFMPNLFDVYLNDALIWNDAFVTGGSSISKLDYDGELYEDFAFEGTQSGISGRIYSMVSQVDEKLIVVGHDDDTTHKSIILARLDLDGELDKKFGKNGKVLLSFSSNDNIAFATSIDSDDRILVAGQSGDSLVIARLWSSKHIAPPNPGVDSLFFGFRPNPVSAILTADYGLPTDGNISIELLDLFGRQVHLFYEETARQAGHYIEPLHFTDQLPNGTYFLRFHSGEYSSLKKLVIVR